MYILKNAERGSYHLVANIGIGVDTAENEPLEVSHDPPPCVDLSTADLAKRIELEQLSTVFIFMIY